MLSERGSKQPPPWPSMGGAAKHPRRLPCPVPIWAFDKNLQLRPRPPRSEVIPMRPFDSSEKPMYDPLDGRA
jgi:hypothetical protein